MITHVRSSMSATFIKLFHLSSTTVECNACWTGLRNFTVCRAATFLINTLLLHSQYYHQHNDWSCGLFAAPLSAHIKSIVTIVCWLQNFFGRSEKFLRFAQLIFNNNHRIRSYCIIAKQYTVNLIVLQNRGVQDRSWTRQNPCSVEMCPAIWYDRLWSVILFLSISLNACLEWLASR